MISPVLTHHTPASSPHVLLYYIFTDNIHQYPINLALHTKQTTLPFTIIYAQVPSHMRLSAPLITTSALLVLASRAHPALVLTTTTTATPVRSIFTRSPTSLFATAGPNNYELESLTVPVLKGRLRNLGLKVGGNKGELVSRLSVALDLPPVAPAPSLSESLLPNTIYISACKS